ncbi:MAG: aminotransferase class V-fold PLP-dependent enzyme [Clostridiales Family XIII bacterium]|nr:aminotransferase class V-fold PLP-dependent enzyme [Clostridiales Family XIII bacterium]
MKLFTLGPVEMYPYTRDLLGEQLPYFRTGAFSEVVLECAERLKRLAGAPADAHVYLLTGSGTGAMEAAVAGCFAPDDHLLVIDGGGFGHRFAEICAHHGISHEAVRVPFGETLSPSHLDFNNKNKPLDAVLVNHHETSVGRLYDLDLIASFCREKNAYLVVDAISSFLADPIDFEGQGIDALILSSQKALALPPGLSMLILSDRLYRRISERDIRPFSLYFDLRDAEANAVRGQTPFTPAVGTILALRERLEHLEAEGGYAAAAAATQALSDGFRAALQGLPVALPAHPLSAACTPLFFPRGGAKAVFKTLSEEHDVWLNPNGGELADKLLRVGHLGALTLEDGVFLAGLLADILTESE